MPNSQPIFTALLLSAFLTTGCDNSSPNTEQTEPREKIQIENLNFIRELPSIGEIVTGRITNPHNLLDEFREFDESDYKVENFESAASLQKLRQSYIASDLGSGRFLAFSPAIEKDYTVERVENSDLLSVIVPRRPQIILTCDDVPYDNDYAKNCTSRNAYLTASLVFEPSPNVQELTLNISADWLQSKSENVRSVYFVSFELPVEIENSLEQLASFRSESIGNNTNAVYQQYNYFLKSDTVIGGISPRGSLTYSIKARLAGVGLYDIKSGEIIAISDAENGESLK